MAAGLRLIGAGAADAITLFRVVLRELGRKLIRHAGSGRVRSPKPQPDVEQVQTTHRTGRIQGKSLLPR